jgi:serine/threonine protein kinase
MTASAGRYRIVDLLGVGGMGMVYRAEDLTLRRPVALKFLSPSLAADEEYRARFLREARVAASLNHPNTCVVYEVGEMDATVDLLKGAEIVGPGTPFIAMELIEIISR